MYHHISGVPNWETKETRVLVKQAHKDFKDSLVHLRGKKEEYKEIKKEYAAEREELKREARIAKMFKFTKMTKKISFLPALKSSDEGFQPMTSLCIGDEYVAWRDKNKLVFPDRAFEKQSSSPHKWGIQKTSADLF